jgi:hypothetical protein
VSTARAAGLFYLLTFVTGIIALMAGSPMVVANAVATVSYVAVTVLFYVLFKPVDARLSLIAALFSFAGCAVGAMNALHLSLVPVNALAFFGIYCLLIGYLIARSSFLPRWLGGLMALGGLGWLTFGWRPLAQALYPYNLAPGIVAEGTLTVWLLVFGAKARGRGPESRVA